MLTTLRVNDEELRVSKARVHISIGLSTFNIPIWRGILSISQHGGIQVVEVNAKGSGLVMICDGKLSDNWIGAGACVQCI